MRNPTQRPDSLTLDHEGMYQVIVFRAGSARLLLEPLISLVVLALLMLWSLDARTLDSGSLEAALAKPGWLQIGLAGVTVFVLLFRLVPALVRAINRTRVRFGAGRLLVRSGPFPPFRSVDKASHEMRELSLDARSAWLGGSPRFMVVARTMAGEPLRLISGIPDKQAALYIKERVQNRLGVPGKRAAKIKVREKSSSFSRTFQHQHPRATEVAERAHSHTWDAPSGRNLPHGHAAADRSREQSAVAGKPAQPMAARTGARTTRQTSLSSLPPHISVAREGMATVITRHWNKQPQNYSIKAVRYGLGVTALVLLFLLQFFGFSLVLIFFAVAGWQLYKKLANHLNNTEIRIDRTWVTCKHMPLFWLACAPVPVKNIESLRVDKVETRNKNGKVTVTWSILAKYRKSESEILVKLPSKQDADLIKRLIGRALRLEERPVIDARVD